MKIKSLHYIIFSIFLTSCGIQGMYKHTICNIGPVCYAYEFCKCGDFRYRFYQSLGNGTIQGNWINKGDTIILNSNDELNNLSTCIKLNHKSKIQKKKIRVFAISTFNDTAIYNGPININNKGWLNTDLNGQIVIDTNCIKSIIFRNGNNSRFSDTSFIFNDPQINYFEIYLADVGKLNDLLTSMTKKFIKRGNRLYPVAEKNSVDFNSKIYYKRIRFGCNYFKEK